MHKERQGMHNWTHTKQGALAPTCLSVSEGGGLETQKLSSLQKFLIQAL